MRILPSVALAALVLNTPGLANAQEGPFTFLGQLILAAGLSPAPEAAVGRTVDVITADDIADRGIDQAVEALRRVPGVAVNRLGGPGGQTVVRLRGTEARHTLVIIDGVRMDQAQQGTFYWEGLQAADIERIEVVRGPQSVFFGSNTIGGVVSITTRRATEPGTGGRVGIEAGSDGTLGLDFAAETRSERGGIGLSGVLRNEGGFDISATPGGQDDGMRNRTLNLSGDWQLTDEWRLGFLLRGRNQINEFDPPAPFGSPSILIDEDREIDLRERIASVYAEGDLADGRLRLNLRASRFQLDSDVFGPVGGARGQLSGDRTRRTELALRGVAALDGGTVDTARHTLGFGIDRTDEDYRATFLPPNDPFFDPALLELRRRSLTGLALEYRGNLAEGLDLQLGLRRDLNDRFANFTTWSAALSWSIPGTDTRLRGSAGTGVQNPTFLQQFGFAPSQFVGNPDLRPEQSRGWDLGVDQGLPGGRGTVSLTLFDNRLTDEIQYDCSAFPVCTVVNDPGRSRRRGVELGFETELSAGLRLRGSYTYLDARDSAGARVIRRPRHEAGLALDWDATAATRLGLELRHVADNLDTDFRPFPAVTDRLPDYTLVNLTAQHRINDRVSLHARINNLTDRRYQEVLGYAAQPRTFYVGLRANF